MIPCEFCGGVLTEADVLTTETHDPGQCRAAMLRRQLVEKMRLLSGIDALIQDNHALRRRIVELERRALPPGTSLADITGNGGS